jgi:hypothetical protein
MASFITAGGALAQSPTVQATVPFDFTVGNKLLPPGTYRIHTTMSGVIMIQNRDKPASALSTAIYDGRQTKGQGKLVFDRYGNQYFLKEVLCTSAGLNVSLPTSKQEKRVRLQEAMVRPTDQVFVASK